ncbi:MAG: tRNA pseudouridine(55) synthase TruB [Chloroflexota bacterium]|nr:tRNA pseudouridine(55) synthase TruB [Chloroflexota bacterium]
MSGRAGFLVVDKPSGVTSFSIVALVRRLTGVRRVGHAGTLDPLASGVLPVAVGQAARLIEYLDDVLKAYTAVVRFGMSTTTYDAEGDVTATADASGLTAASVRAALAGFVGDIEQVPPAYSAIKLAGKPLYRYAREGADVAPAPRRVHIERIDLLRCGDGEAAIAVRCGKGTYIRSLAHDLGQRLGCGAHLAALRRTRSGGFSLDDAHPPDELVAAAADGALDELLLAPDRAVERQPAAIVGEANARAVATGRDLAIAAAASVALCRAYTSDGDFVGVLRRRAGGLWHPEKVLWEPART